MSIYLLLYFTTVKEKRNWRKWNLSTELLNDSCPVQRVRSQIRRKLKKPTLTNGFIAVQVGSAPASTRYIKHKQRDCEKVHFHSEVHRLPADITQETLIEYIEALTVRPAIYGHSGVKPTALVVIHAIWLTHIHAIASLHLLN